MSAEASDPLLETLVNDFGGNYVFALDVLEQYRSDRQSVDASWRAYFDKALGVPPEPEPPSRGKGGDGASGRGAVVAKESARKGTLVRQEPPGVPARDRSKAVAIPAILPGDIAQPIRGGAVRIVENMEASLSIPTATSIRTIPVRTLEENRRGPNKHPEALGESKNNFTPPAAWAIGRTPPTLPRPNHTHPQRGR